jgi:hypothetical protein
MSRNDVMIVRYKVRTYSFSASALISALTSVDCVRTKMMEGSFTVDALVQSLVRVVHMFAPCSKKTGFISNLRLL